LQRLGIGGGFLADNSDSGGGQLTIEIQAHRYSKGILENKNISLAREVPYTLFVNDREILSISTLPSNLEELFVGFLVSEGILLNPKEVLVCAVDHAARLVRIELDVPSERVSKFEKKGMLTSGCAGGMVFSVEVALLPAEKERKRLKIHCSTIIKRMQELDRFEGTYTITRGVHAAALADSSRTIAILEDLGRHNAVDKIIGHCFLSKTDTRDKLLLSTGRITSEMLVKAARSRFPIVISRSSASSMAVAMAKQSNVDVVTYVRAGRFNYFDHGGAELIED
jgi:FdhD protein